MAEVINFDEATAERFLECIRTGEPIEGPWTFDRMMMLAGACLFAARSHGPLNMRAAKGGAGDLVLEALPDDMLLTTDDQFLKDSAAAVGFYAQLAMMVKDGDYSRDFAPNLKAFVQADGDNVTITPISGYKPRSN